VPEEPFGRGPDEQLAITAQAVRGDDDELRLLAFGECGDLRRWVADEHRQFGRRHGTVHSCRLALDERLKLWQDLVARQVHVIGDRRCTLQQRLENVHHDEPCPELARQDVRVAQRRRRVL
jgi:hypothetical protein